jgi:hypothetical protein
LTKDKNENCRSSVGANSRSPVQEFRINKKKETYFFLAIKRDNKLKNNTIVSRIMAVVQTNLFTSGSGLL